MKLTELLTNWRIETMEYPKSPTEHKMETIRRVTYNAEIEKLINGQKLAKITATDLDNAKLRKLLLDITGLDAAN